MQCLDTVIGRPVHKDERLISLALSSIQASSLASLIKRHSGVRITAADLLQVDSAADLRALVESRVCPTAETASPPRRPPFLLESVNKANQDVDDPVAIRGVALRLPGNVKSLEEAWAAFLTGQGAEGLDILTNDGESASGRRAWLPRNDIESFDNHLFGISDEEALFVKPQQRLALEVMYEALSDACLRPSSLRGKRVGVFCAASGQDGYERLLESAMGPKAHNSRFWGHGTSAAAVSGRIAHYLGVEGPVMTFETACSGSLVALWSAHRSLLNGDCDVAIVGGVATNLHPGTLAFMRCAGMTSQSSQGSQAFGVDTDGMCASEGAIFVVLQRNSKMPDGLGRCLIRGSQVRHQGASANMLMTRADAQSGLHSSVLQESGWQPGQVDLVEAHGTGTSLGDQIELLGIQETFGDLPVFVSSSKTVFGHTLEAAGLLGVVKACMCLDLGVVPPLHVENLQHRGDKCKAVIPSEETPAPRLQRALVCSYGFSGTMAAVTMEKPLAAGPLQARSSLPILLLSAPSVASLRRLADACNKWLAKQQTCSSSLEDALERLSHNINAGRDLFACRRAIAFEQGASDIFAGLLDLSRVKHLSTYTATSKTIVVQFTGMGRIEIGAARQLFDRHDVYREGFSRVCSSLMRAGLDVDVKAVLYPPSKVYHERSKGLLERPVVAQACQLAVSIALWHTLTAYIARTSIHTTCGHSFGEVVAAYASGLLNLDEVCALVLARAAHCERTWKGDGAMLATRASKAAVAAHLVPGVSVAAVNSDSAVTLSGTVEAIHSLKKRLAGENITSKLLESQGVAYHHPRLSPDSEHLSQWNRSGSCNTPRFFSTSNSSGCDWPQHIVNHVPYSTFMEQILDRVQPDVLIEVGLGPDLSSFSRDALRKKRQQEGRSSVKDTVVLPLFSTPSQCHLPTLVGRLFELGGIPIEWPHGTARADLDIELFEKKRHWPEKLLLRNDCENTVGLGWQQQSSSSRFTIAKTITNEEAEALAKHRSEDIMSLLIQACSLLLGTNVSFVLDHLALEQTREIDLRGRSIEVRVVPGRIASLVTKAYDENATLLLATASLEQSSANTSNYDNSIRSKGTDDFSDTLKFELSIEPKSIVHNLRSVGQLPEPLNLAAYHMFPLLSRTLQLLESKSKGGIISVFTAKDRRWVADVLVAEDDQMARHHDPATPPLSASSGISTSFSTPTLSQQCSGNEIVLSSSTVCCDMLAGVLWYSCSPKSFTL